jgi:GNAT superfamily N-acetyltransferase
MFYKKKIMFIKGKLIQRTRLVFKMSSIVLIHDQGECAFTSHAWQSLKDFLSSTNLSLAIYIDSPTKQVFEKDILPLLLRSYGCDAPPDPEFVAYYNVYIERRIVFLMYSQDLAVGIGLMRLQKDEAHINAVGVDPMFRRRGIMKHLFMAMESLGLELSNLLPKDLLIVSYEIDIGKSQTEGLMLFAERRGYFVEKVHDELLARKVLQKSDLDRGITT